MEQMVESACAKADDLSLHDEVGRSLRLSEEGLARAPWCFVGVRGVSGPGEGLTAPIYGLPPHYAWEGAWELMV